MSVCSFADRETVVPIEDEPGTAPVANRRERMPCSISGCIGQALLGFGTWSIRQPCLPAVDERGIRE